MICHQGSARASQRLRQGSVRQPKVSPLPSKAHALYLATSTPHPPPKAIRDHSASRTAGARLPSEEGTAACSPSLGWISRVWDIWQTPSIQQEPRDSRHSGERCRHGAARRPQHLQHEAPAPFAKRFQSGATEAR